MTTVRVRGAVLLALTAALAWSCGGDGTTLGPDGAPIVDDGMTSDDGGNAPAVTLAQLSEEIFTPKCALSGCHAGSFPSGNMSLSADRIAAEIIDVASVEVPGLKRIAPGNPADSYLVRKVKGVDVNSQMPLSRAPLSAAEIQKIVDWVTAGAKAEG